MKEKKPQLSDERLLEIIENACKEFEGDCTVLESAIGALVWGRVVGWHALRLMHSSRTFKKYEETLFVKFRDVLPDRTPQSRRMKGIVLLDDVGKFWQAITAGMVPAREAKLTA